MVEGRGNSGGREAGSHRNKPPDLGYLLLRHSWDFVQEDRVEVFGHSQVVYGPRGRSAEGVEGEAACAAARRRDRDLTPLHLQSRRRHLATRRQLLPAALKGALRARAQGVHPSFGGEVHQAVVRGLGVKGVDLAGVFEEGDGREELGAVQTVQVEVPRETVRGGHQRDPPPQQGLQQPPEDHRVCHVRHLELVEAEEPRLLGDLRGHLHQRVRPLAPGARRPGARLQLEEAPVHVLHETVEVLAGLRHAADAVEEQVVL